ncbi:acyl-CoA dehydrogenase family protein [Microbacterium sp. SORGH_AS_0888]|uniref:acyl-CoA dehydrogenase family protein n=1 Tax=Microbacterium sp. SORGH_AS_0888 TaxID=3041791 RepID=UPI002784EDAB|nr:acyl-CoA dehydrogenase family protein [Microbacterium sp. SORGH_AS_0888]MDQ1130553.1 alkylation response protein AidB-like acyl-CoA dehydrogenase [Microbacterium sp. SORGH_AS_0888]
MTRPHPVDDELIARFAPLFARIAEGAAARERSRSLPHDEVAQLRAAGLGALRVPVELGGHGASLRQLLLVLRELAAADSNLPQALRQHFYQVELLLHDADDPENRVWLERVAAGDLFGSATTEPRGSALGQVSTVLTAHPEGGYRLNGRKIYGTGNAYAQWLPVGAVDEAGVPVAPVVPIDRAGVTIVDDWNGFGQRLTATGSSVFEDVVVAESEVRRFPTSGPRRGGSGLHQAVLLATLAGIAEAARRELTGILRAKTRVYFTGTGELPRHDAVVQEQVGRVRAVADAARWILDGAGRELEQAWTRWFDPSATPEEVDAGFVDAELAVSSAQVTISEQVLDATSHLLDVLGASSLDVELGLDRHWRNARAVASHNPYPFKARLLGDHDLNGAEPETFAVGKDVGDKPAG